MNIGDSVCFVSGKKALKAGKDYRIDSVYALPNRLAELNEAKIVITASMYHEGLYAGSHTTIALNLNEQDSKKLLASIVKVVQEAKTEAPGS